MTIGDGAIGFVSTENVYTSLRESELLRARSASSCAKSCADVSSTFGETSNAVDDDSPGWLVS